ncbi:ABC transporter substrate-binding protein [Enterobacteriaceae bacterium 4M9]|nr:ABC transporter substrate-binding protein [Enterobacteriaceae bacterium 4M9]
MHRRNLFWPVLLCASGVQAEQLTVFISGGFNAALEKLGPAFVAQHGDTLKIVRGPSMGDSAEAIPNRLARGERADAVIMVGYALDGLIKQGRIVPGSRVELADSRIGAVVRKGESRPDISSVENLKATLLRAKSIAWSDSASGRYIEDKMLTRLGIQQSLSGKGHRVERDPVGEAVAKGKYEIGFQQVSELLPVQGVTFIGKIPEQLQSVTRFAGAVPEGSTHQQKARDLLNYLASQGVQIQVRATGLDSIAAS